MDDNNDEVIKFEGFMKLTGNDKTQRVYFDSNDEEDMIKAGFFYFVLKDFKDSVRFLLVNPNEGHIRTIDYEREK